MSESSVLYFNGRLLTCNNDSPYAQAMIVRGDRILWVGDDADTAKVCDAFAVEQKVDLSGRCVLPGFIDAHMHPVTLAEFSRQISVLPPEITSIEQLIGKIREVRQTMGGRSSGWIQGWGFDEGKLAEGRTPTRYDLDLGADDVPVSIVRACQHIRVVNSKALEICGIDADTPDPEGGQIDRDENGEPTGILRENARLLVPPFIPETDEQEIADMITELGELLASQGVIAIADLGSLDGSDNYERYRKAIARGLKQDVAMYYMWEDQKENPAFDITPAQMAEGQQLRVCGLKILGDGTFSGHTAWMEEPYPQMGEQAAGDDEDNYGISTCSEDLLESAIAFCRSHHCQLALHAMGRRTIRRFVDRLAAEEPWMGSDPQAEACVPFARMEHVTDPAPESIAKAAAAGIAWSTQPVFLFSEIESYLANLGETWMKRCYPIRSILDAGVQLSLSTDAPATAWATPSDPLVNIRAAVTRIAYDGTDCNPNDDTGGSVDERIDIETAIRLYTTEAAKILGLHDLGRLAPGYRASFVILDQDIRAWDVSGSCLCSKDTVSHDRIHVAETYINGERVYCKGSPA